MCFSSLCFVVQRPFSWQLTSQPISSPFRCPDVTFVVVNQLSIYQILPSCWGFLPTHSDPPSPIPSPCPIQPFFVFLFFAVSVIVPFPRSTKGFRVCVCPKRQPPSISSGQSSNLLHHFPINVLIAHTGAQSQPRCPYICAPAKKSRQQADDKHR